MSVLLALLAAALAASPARAKVYFSAFPGEGGTAIERAGFDGSELEALQLEPTGFDDGLALDMRDGVMYWSDTNASVIRRANLNGSEAQIVVDDFGWEPLGLALDLERGKLYWNDRQGIKRANLDGSGEELLTSGAAGGFLALDLAAQRMYWIAAGAIKSAEMSPSATVSTIISGQSAPFGLAVDHAAGKLYWLQLNKKNQIRRSNLDGSEAETIVERPGAGFEGGLAIDPAAGKLYWTEAAARDIASSNLDGSQAQALFSTGEASPVGLAIESVDPRPANGSPPLIEGRPQVGSALSCNPGSWSGTGPVSLTYRWLLGGTPVEGVSGPVYVSPAEASGATLACAVTATDRVAQTSAMSGSVTVAALAPEPASAPRALIAGIALARITSSGSRARVPVFSSLACSATLTAKPIKPAHQRGRGRRRAHAAARSGPSLPRTARRMLAPGRSTITLTGLIPGTTYRLKLSLECAAGRSAADTATLVVRRRRRAQPPSARARHRRPRGHIGAADGLLSPPG